MNRASTFAVFVVVGLAAAACRPRPVGLTAESPRVHTTYHHTSPGPSPQATQQATQQPRPPAIQAAPGVAPPAETAALPRAGYAKPRNVDLGETKQAPRPRAKSHVRAKRAPAPAPAPTVASRRSARRITFNGKALTAKGWAALRRLERSHGQRLPDGAYWYDRKSGAAGRWGGPTESFFPAGLALGPRLPRNASGGRTGVVINGRDIHIDEYRWLGNLIGYAPRRGRYWLDANGNVGIEGGPALANLVALANQKATRGGKKSGRGFNHYQRGVGSGGSIGVAGDGQTTCVNTAAYTRCY